MKKKKKLKPPLEIWRVEWGSGGRGREEAPFDMPLTAEARRAIIKAPNGGVEGPVGVGAGALLAGEGGLARGAPPAPPCALRHAKDLQSKREEGPSRQSRDERGRRKE